MQNGEKLKPRTNNAIVYLHDELPASGQAPFRKQYILWLLLLLGLLNLSQTADWVHALAVVWSCLGGKQETHNCQFHYHIYLLNYQLSALV